jgi:hypothetical protein
MEWGWDLLSEWTLPSGEAFVEIQRIMESPGIKRLLQEDEDRFIERKAVMMMPCIFIERKAVMMMPCIFIERKAVMMMPCTRVCDTGIIFDPKGTVFDTPPENRRGVTSTRDRAGWAERRGPISGQPNPRWRKRSASPANSAAP